MCAHESKNLVCDMRTKRIFVYQINIPSCTFHKCQDGISAKQTIPHGNCFGCIVGILATLVALHFTPFSHSLGLQSFKTSVASWLASLSESNQMF